MLTYISGKVTGLGNYRELFDEATQHLIEQGEKPVNPTELHHELWDDWATCMKRCIIALMQCDQVYALSNWRDSAGATIEINLALALGMEVIYRDSDCRAYNRANFDDLLRNEKV